MLKAILIGGAVGACALACAQEAVPQPAAPSLEERLAALEQRAAVLEQQNAQLRQFITTNGNSLTIRAAGNLSVEGGGQVILRAGSNASLDAAASTRIRSNGETAVEAAGALRLNAPSVLVNGGGRPVARVGDTLAPGPNGTQVLQGGSPSLSTN